MYVVPPVPEVPALSLRNTESAGRNERSRHSQHGERERGVVFVWYADKAHVGNKEVWILIQNHKPD